MYELQAYYIKRNIGGSSLSGTVELLDPGIGICTTLGSKRLPQGNPAIPGFYKALYCKLESSLKATIIYKSLFKKATLN